MNTPKPFSVSYAEFKSNLDSIISNCELPPCIVSDLLAMCVRSLDEIAKKQHMNDLIAYQKSKKQYEENSETGGDA